MRNFLISFLFSLVSVMAMAQATQLTGTLNNPDGTGYNGQLTLTLAQQASISSASGCGGPVLVPSTVQVLIKIVNGAMTSPPKIYGSDCTLPYGVPYNVIARDLNGNVDFTAQWLPLGSIQDIGTIQTVVNPLGTLFGLSLSDLALTGAQNVFTEDNTFAQNVTIDGNLTVDGTIFGPTGGPVTVQGTGGAIDFEVKNSVGTPNFIVYDSNIVAISGALGVGGVINTNTGYEFNSGGGTAGQCLVSNGSVFIPGACTAVLPAQYYYIDSFNGFGFPQRVVNEFLSPLLVTDNPAGNRTNITLAKSGVAAGTYTYPSSLTVDTYGRVSSIANGSVNTQVLKEVKVGAASICTTQGLAFSNCPTPITWPTPFADANYVPVWVAGTPTNFSITGTWIDYSSVSASGLTFWIQNGDANAAHPVSLQSIYCIAIHP